MSHYNQNWDDLGQNIQDTIDRAVSSFDFQKLSQNIQGAVERAVQTERDRQDLKKLYSGTVGKYIKAFLKLLCGGLISLFGFLAVVGAMMAGLADTNDIVTFVFVILLLAGGCYLIHSGGATVKLLKRYKAYRRTLGSKTYCPLERLAGTVGKSQNFVRRDLQKMIRKDYFKQGHLNKEQTYFLSSHQSYQFFEQSRVQLEQQQKEKQQIAVNPAAEQLQEILNKGNSYIAQIRKCNDDIPGQEMSDKIFRIEMLVQRIFDRVKAQPEIVPDLKKLMEYYLPMTVKLLKAYADMDMQPVQGETIRASKLEIEKSLDTINYAFEKLLDDLFAETAMDVSSDISVLNTLLAQEGLTEDGLAKLRVHNEYEEKIGE